MHTCDDLTVNVGEDAIAGSGLQQGGDLHDLKIYMQLPS
jgi:hypothetical protein